MKENVKVIGPMVFSPFENINFTTEEKEQIKPEKKEPEELDVAYSLIAEFFTKKLEEIAEGGRRSGIAEEEVNKMLAPIKKLIEAYIESVNTKAHTIAALTEAVLTVILVIPRRLNEFTNIVQNSFHTIAAEEVMKKIETIIKKKEE